MEEEKIKLSISGTAADESLEEANRKENFTLLREYGFTHIHFGHEWRASEPIPEDELEAIQQNLEAAGLQVLDVHGPHPSGKKSSLDVSAEDEEDRKLAFDMFRSRLKVTHALGGDAMVYHVPTAKEQDEKLLTRYVDGLQRLEDEARELGIVIALENHYRKEVDRRTLSACFEKFDREYIGFTLDSGHAKMSDNTDWLLSNCMERLTVLHLNDNNGTQDKHWLPYHPEGTVDWQAVIQAIAKSPYRKPLQMEVSWRSNQHLSRLEFLNTAAKTGRKLDDELRKYREEAK